MLTNFKASEHFKLYAVALAMAALVIALLVIGVSTGPAQAQNGGGDTSDDTPLNSWPDPQPCGPEAGTADMDEPHELTTGHYALFDAYWEKTPRDPDADADDPNEGIMHTNECPPKVTKKVETVYDSKTDQNVQIVTWPRSASGIDTKEAIMHVLDEHQATVIDSNDGEDNTSVVTGPTIDLAEYPALVGTVSAGDKVWWLQLDDPDTDDVDETSDLRIGFSTALFDDEHWLGIADQASMRWMLETTRYKEEDPGSAPHFFAFEAPMKDDEVQDAVWDSTEADVEDHDVRMDPGEYRSLQWVFTQEGSYTLQAHLQGFVRKTEPGGANDWIRISSKEDETSEIKEYVFQVGNKLAETEPPMFGVSATVHEDADAGAHVGQPIRVFGAEVETLYYTLTGTGKENFSVVARTKPFAAQVTVAANAKLDHDTKDSYDLVLEVSDHSDHEGNRDESADHKIAVEVEVIAAPHVYMIASDHSPAVGDSVTVSANVWALPADVQYDSVSYNIWETSSNGESSFIFLDPAPGDSRAVTTVVKDAAGTYKYTPTAVYTQGATERRLHGDPVTITWHNP